MFNELWCEWAPRKKKENTFFLKRSCQGKFLIFLISSNEENATRVIVKSFIVSLGEKNVRRRVFNLGLLTHSIYPPESPPDTTCVLCPSGYEAN